MALAYATPAQQIREDFGVARFDQNVSAEDSFSANYLIDDGDKNNRRPNPNFVDVSYIRGEVIGFQEPHIFSPTLLNTVNFGYSRADAMIATPPAVRSRQISHLLPAAFPARSRSEAESAPPPRRPSYPRSATPWHEM